MPPVQILPCEQEKKMKRSAHNLAAMLSQIPISDGNSAKRSGLNPDRFAEFLLRGIMSDADDSQLLD
jgi:hypothetical protein